MTKQLPAATAPRAKGTNEHNFRVSHAEWEASVFDNATTFTAVAWHPILPGERERHEFKTFAEATVFVTNAPARPAGRGWCVYAVTLSGRSIVLDRAAWPAWQARN